MLKMQLPSPRSSRALLGSAGAFILIVSFFVIHNFQSAFGSAHSHSDAIDTTYEQISPDEGGSRIRQATTTLHDGYDSVFERAVKSHIKHGEAWGYPTNVLRHSMLDGNSQFNKLSYLQMLLLTEMAKPYGQRAGWIVWFDADTIILNSKVPWTIFLPPPTLSHVHLLGTKNWDGFNSGVFLIRVHEWSVKMLADAQALPFLRPEIGLQWADQSAMVYSFSRPQFREGVVFQPLHWYNEFQRHERKVGVEPNVQPGDMLIHFAGLMKDKREFMGPWLDRVENLADQWTVPLENTTYLSDVKEFWEIYGNANDILNRANNTLSFALRDSDFREPVVKAIEDLQKMMWDGPRTSQGNVEDNVEGMRTHAEHVWDTLQQALRQNSAAKFSQVEVIKAGTAETADEGAADAQRVPSPMDTPDAAT